MVELLCKPFYYSLLRLKLNDSVLISFQKSLGVTVAQWNKLVYA